MARFNRRQATISDGFSDALIIRVPKSISTHLKALATENKVPVSTLVCRAICNEAESGYPFTYSVNLVEYTEEEIENLQFDRKKLYDFVKANKFLTLELISQAWKDIGLSSKEITMKLCKYFLDVNIFELYKPRYKEGGFVHNDNYRRVRIKPEHSAAVQRVLKKREKKAFKGVLDDL